MNKTFLWVDLSLFNQSYSGCITTTKSLPDIGDTTIQYVGPLAAMGGAMEPGGCFTNVSRALQKFFRNLCIAQIVLVMRISSGNFERVPKALLWAHI